MAARGCARLQLQLHKIELGINFQINLKSWGIKFGLGLGWLRAVAQGCNYSYNKIKFGCNCQRKLKSLRINLSWGLDGCARWRKVTITVAVKLNLGVIFKGISRVRK